MNSSGSNLKMKGSDFVSKDTFPKKAKITVTLEVEYEMHEDGYSSDLNTPAKALAYDIGVYGKEPLMYLEEDSSAGKLKVKSVTGQLLDSSEVLRVYPEYVLIANREMLGIEEGDSSKDHLIYSLPPMEVFENYLKHEGIIGYAGRLLRLFEDVFKVSPRDSETSIDSSLASYLERRIQHAQSRADTTKESHGANPSDTHTYYGGQELGRWEGKVSAYENVQDFLKTKSK